MSVSPVAPGSDVVLIFLSFRGSNPLEFNSRNRPGNPCRGEVVKIGRKYVHVQGNERSPWKALPAFTREAAMEALSGPHALLHAVPVGLAKDLYREYLTRSNTNPEWVSKCVDEL